jgi:hypothetical protein
VRQNTQSQLQACGDFTRDSPIHPGDPVSDETLYASSGSIEENNAEIDR